MASHHSEEIRREAAKKPAHVWEGMSRSAAAKADAAARSGEPWALRNLRLYQGLEHKWAVYASAARALEAPEC